MSYDGSYGRGGGGGGGGGTDGRQGYGGQQDLSEYGGGGGRGSDNYYNQQSSYNETSSGYSQGGSEYQSGSNYQQSADHDDDYQGALSHAQQHSSSHKGSGGNNAEESNIFANALGFLAGNKHNFANENIDEHQAINAHQAIYGGESQHHHQQQQQHGSETLGAGAALQALKLFTGGGGAGAAEGHGGHGSGNSQNKLIGLAMAQASSLFDQQSKHGKVDPSASKQDAVNSAAKLALKMYMKGQGGGGGGGGPAGLLGKFL